MAQPIAPSVVQDAIVQIMQGALGRGHPVDTDMARTLAVRLASAVEAMGLHSVTSTALSSQAAFHALVSQHPGSPSAASYDPAFRAQLQRAIDSANIHGPGYLGGVFDGIRLALGLEQASTTQDARGPATRSGRPDYSTLPGNTDMSGITAANFHTSPITRDIFLAGMSYHTFNWMRHLPGENFNRTHIQHAAQDAALYGLNPNDRAVARNLGILSRDNGGRRQQRHDLMAAYTTRLEADQELIRLGRLRDQATGDERTRIERLMVARNEVMMREMGIGTFASQAPTQAAQQANQEIFVQRFWTRTGIRLERYQQLRSEGTPLAEQDTRQTIVAPPPPPSSLPIAVTQARADAVTADAGDRASRLAALRAQSKGPTPGSG